MAQAATEPPAKAPAQGAPKKPSRAVVGGVEHVFGGWGRYEAARRREQWRQSRVRPGTHYAGRRFVGAGDAIGSLLGASPRASPESKVGGAGPVSPQDAGPLRQAARRLARALGDLEDKLCSPDEDGAWDCAGPGGAIRVPELRSADLWEFAASPSAPTDAETLRDLGRASRAVAAMAGEVLPAVPELEPPGSKLPPLPPSLVDVDDDEGVLALESAVRPHVAALEDLQAAVASCLETSARAIGRIARRASAAPGGQQALPSKGRRPLVGAGERRGAAERKARPKKAPADRGEAVDRAAESPPLALLDAPLPFKGANAFAVEAGSIRVTDGVPGPYYGFGAADLSDRATSLDPAVASWAARVTSGRSYAWVILDCPEARYAVRADPVGGRVVTLSPDEIIRWLRPRLVGQPPHKIASAPYLAYLRGLGLTIVARHQRLPDIRFRLTDMVPAAEREAEAAALRALSAQDFAAYDWRDFDAKLGRKACALPVELGGEIVIDRQARKILVSKTREGSPWSSQVYLRSAASAHSHPLGHALGRAAEPPSLTDLRNALLRAEHGHVWSLVAAPEGTYIVRPSALAQEAYRRDPAIWDAIAPLAEQALDLVQEMAPGAAARAIAAALADAGFVVYFRAAPCTTLAERPDTARRWNRLNPAAFAEALRRHRAAPVAALEAADWSALDSLFAATPRAEPSWAAAALKVGPKGRAVVAPVAGSHHLESLDKAEDYPAMPGPIAVFYIPAGGRPFPRAVPLAALEAFRRNSALWAWAAFLSPGRLLVFRVDREGVEVGSASRGAAAGSAPAPLGAAEPLRA